VVDYGGEKQFTTLALKFSVKICRNICRFSRRRKTFWNSIFLLEKEMKCDGGILPQNLKEK